MRDQDVNQSLRFQLSLLRLAVIPHSATPNNAPATEAARELVRLAKRVPAEPGQQTGL